MGSDGGRFTALCTTGQKGHQGWPFPICSICPQPCQARLLNEYTHFSTTFCVFSIILKRQFPSQLKWQLSFASLFNQRGGGERELQGCSNTSGQNKSFLRRHPVTRLPVNDTSSSYSSRNDLVCVALLVVRETAGGSLEMSLVIVWRCRQRERQRQRPRESELVSSSTCCTHQGGTVAPCT